MVLVILVLVVISVAVGVFIVLLMVVVVVIVLAVVVVLLSGINRVLMSFQGLRAVDRQALQNQVKFLFLARTKWMHGSLVSFG